MINARSFLTVAVALLAACASSTDIPDAAPTVEGVVSALEGQSRVLIEGDVARCERYWFRIMPDTRILMQSADGKVAAASIEDVTIGRNARAWANGPIAESCPAQTNAGVILLLEGGAQIRQSSDAPMQTDSTSYVLERDSIGWRAQIGYVFRNTTPDTMYMVNCNGARTVALEKKYGDEWRSVWTPISNACLSPPIEIAPGAAINGPLDLWGAPPNTNYGPSFTDTVFGGTYRLAWWNLRFHYDTNRQNFGDTVPARFRVSNEFTLR